MPSVSSPLSTTHALNGDSVMPAVRTTGPNTSTMSFDGPHKAPAITRPWPSRYLVPECITRSAPNSAGRCNAGEQKQLSTASKAPTLCARSASAAMSQTSVSGLVGVSANSSLVVGRNAAFHSAMSVCDTNVVSTPNLPNSRPISVSVEPNIEREHTTWSPALSSPMHIINMAPIPLDAAMAASVPSSAARRRSKLLTVGFDVRP